MLNLQFKIAYYNLSYVDMRTSFVYYIFYLVSYTYCLKYCIRYPTEIYKPNTKV